MADIGETHVAELRRLSHELESIGNRAGNLGHTSETLKLLARTTVLVAESLSSLTERVGRLERHEPRPPRGVSG
jgi:hypothetical protein